MRFTRIWRNVPNPNQYFRPGAGFAYRYNTVSQCVASMCNALVAIVETTSEEVNMNHSLRKSMLAYAIALSCGLSASYVAAAPQSSGYDEYQSSKVPVDDQTQGDGKAGSLTESAGSPGTANDDATKTIGENELYSMTPETLNTMTVIGREDKELGSIDKVVSERQTGKIYAVISSGGIWGIGTKKTVVPLYTLRLDGEQVRLHATSEELSARESYAPDMYTEVKPEDRPVSEFSAFEEITK